MARSLGGSPGEMTVRDFNDLAVVAGLQDAGRLPIFGRRLVALTEFTDSAFGEEV